MKLPLKFYILASESSILLVRSFISNNTKQLVLKFSLEQLLIFAMINNEEDEWRVWIGGRLGISGEDSKLCFIGKV